MEKKQYSAPSASIVLVEGQLLEAFGSVNNELGDGNQLSRYSNFGYNRNELWDDEEED